MRAPARQKRLGRLLGVWLAGWVWLAAPGAARAQPDKPTALDYFLIVTGSELLTGVYADRHTHFITGTLQPLGCHCVGSLSVDDKAADLTEALRFATRRAPLVLVTGGLGPTDDDITRETLSAFTAIPLEEHPDVMASMEQRFNQPRDQIRPNLRRQALVPKNGAYLKNPAGTAVGLVFDRPSATVVALPGPPRELQAMVTAELIPFLRLKYGVRRPGSTRTLRFVGIGQSAIYQTLHERVELPSDLTLTSMFEAERVDVTLALPQDTPEDQARLETLGAKVRELLGPYIYATGTDTLEAVVVNTLRSARGKLVLAEVGSGGLLAASLNGAPAAASVVVGGYVAPSEPVLARLLGLSPPVWSAEASADERVRQFARGARRLAEADWAVAVGGPQFETGRGASLLVAFVEPNDAVEVQRFTLGAGDTGRARLVNGILDRLRRLAARAKTPY
ncbi:MAG: hypothetical protein FJ387_14265 [Verrucomicrobia bacterium]|nr:hypothetical protein [Verrucomicrobiota bacterium]